MSLTDMKLRWANCEPKETLGCVHTVTIWADPKDYCTKFGPWSKSSRSSFHPSILRNAGELQFRHRLFNTFFLNR